MLSLDDGNFDDDPETIIHVSLMAWCNRYTQHKACKKDISKKLMPVAQHPKMVGLVHIRRWKKIRNITIFDW